MQVVMSGLIVSCETECSEFSDDIVVETSVCVIAVIIVVSVVMFVLFVILFVILLLLAVVVILAVLLCVFISVFLIVSDIVDSIGIIDDASAVDVDSTCAPSVDVAFEGIVVAFPSILVVEVVAFVTGMVISVDEIVDVDETTVGSTVVVTGETVLWNKIVVDSVALLFMNA